MWIKWSCFLSVLKFCASSSVYTEMSLWVYVSLYLFHYWYLFVKLSLFIYLFNFFAIHRQHEMAVLREIIYIMWCFVWNPQTPIDSYSAPFHLATCPPIFLLGQPGNICATCCRCHPREILTTLGKEVLPFRVLQLLGKTNTGNPVGLAEQFRTDSTVAPFHQSLHWGKQGTNSENPTSQSTSTIELA